MEERLRQIRSQDAEGIVKFLIIITYISAIVFAEVMFIQIMKDVFPDGFIRWFAIFGAIMNGATACIMPFAKDHYFAPGKMHNVGLGLWGVDVVVMILNVLLAFEVRQGVTTGGMFSWWYHLSPASPLMAVITWGVLMVLSPEHDVHQKEMLRKTYIATAYAEAEFEYIEDGGVKDILEAGARANVRDYADKLAKRKIRVTVNKPKELPALVQTGPNGNHQDEEAVNPMPPRQKG